MKGVKPSQIRTAVALLYGSLILGAIGGVIQATSAGAMWTFHVMVLSGTLLFMVILTECISSGRNWARWVYLVMGVLGLPMFLLALPGQLAQGIYFGSAVGVLQWLVAAIVLYLLFLSDGQIWFERVGEAGKS